MKIAEGRVVEVGHVTEVYGPVQALRNYLIPRCAEFAYVSHPFSYSRLEGTRVELYANGGLVRTEKGHKRSANQLLQWLRDILFNLRHAARQREKITLYVGVDNLNALCGIILRAFGRVDKVVYYVIDHTPRRFANPVLNAFYTAVDGIACRGADHVWCLSARMAKAKASKFRLSESKFQVVPVGIELEKIAPSNLAEKLLAKTMVLMSMLDRTKGVQVLIESMPDILRQVPEASLIIIGTGPIETELRAQAASLRLESSVSFLGAMDHEALFKFIPHQRIGLAPYADDPNSYTYFADPTKPKEYLACGLPVVMTDVPWIAEEVRTKPMGVVCAYRKDEIAAACVRLLTDDEFYVRCHTNALEFARHLSWDRIYDEAFERMGIRSVDRKNE